jgi:hypothetical protein
LEVLTLVFAANFYFCLQLLFQTNLITIIFFQPSYASTGHKTDLWALRSYDKWGALPFFTAKTQVEKIKLLFIFLCVIAPLREITAKILRHER